MAPADGDRPARAQSRGRGAPAQDAPDGQTREPDNMNMTTSRQPEFVWSPRPDAARQAFVLFRRDLVLQRRPETARIHLFSDTRYRLRANGRFVYAGPPRFVTQFPEYDTVDLAPYLRRGANCLTVEVNFYGASSYQTMRDGRPGFICWGTVGDGADAVDLATPGAWRCRRLDAWDERAPLYSFAQNPVEICDTRRLDPAWYLPAASAGGGDAEGGDSGWQPPVEVSRENRPWGPLKPSTAPRPRYTPVVPETIVRTASLAADEDRWGFTIPERSLGDPQAAPQNQFVGFSTWIYSPRAMTATAGLHWGTFALNGEPFAAHRHPFMGNRSSAELKLREGWNHFTGKVEYLPQCEFWSFLLALPKGEGLVVRALPERSETAAFLLSDLLPPDRIVFPGRGPSNAEPPPGWRRVRGDPAEVCPARLCAWERPGDHAQGDLPYRKLKEVAEASADGRFWVFRFAESFLGHVVVDIEGPAGTAVDIGFDDWLRDDGMIHLYKTNPYVNSVERIILRGGRQRVQLFNSRGGRFLQILARPAPGGGVCRLHGVRVLETKTLDSLGDFRCSDRRLTRIWKAAARTLIDSSEDSYSDSPWRERGTYIGDCYVNVRLHRLLHHDLTLSRRALRLFAQTATPDGQLFCVAPSWLARPHEDFTLVWVLMLREYWALTGDLALVEELWPVVTLILASPGIERHESGLWNADGRRLFIDWGVIREERQGPANACLNAFRIAALERAAELADRLNKSDEAARFRAECAELRRAFSERLWLPDEGRFAAALPRPGVAPTGAFHANILAYRFGIGTTEQLAAVEEYVIRKARGNYAQGLAGGQGSGHAELYFMAYLLPALAEHGRYELAENLILEHYGTIVDDGLDTLPECFCRWNSGVGSACHSWSGFPAVYATRYVLGLRQAEPGNPDRFVLDPQASPRISRAEGVFPHPRGPIRAAWRRRGASFEFSFDAPEGVTVAAAR